MIYIKQVPCTQHCAMENTKENIAFVFRGLTISLGKQETKNIEKTHAQGFGTQYKCANNSEKRKIDVKWNYKN